VADDGPIAAAVLWMGVYPESFLAPMRKDIAALDARLARAPAKATRGRWPRRAALLRPRRTCARGGALMDFATSLALDRARAAAEHLRAWSCCWSPPGAATRPRAISIAAASRCSSRGFFLVPRLGLRRGDGPGHLAFGGQLRRSPSPASPSC
jgi:hypothetical protein